MKLAFAVIPGMIIGCFAFFSIFMVCCFRFICNCCGGRNQSANVCCPPSSDKHIPARYSGKDILRAKIWMYVAALMAVAALIWGNTSSAQLVGGLKDFGGAVSGIPDHIFAKIEQLNASLTLPVYDAQSNTTKIV